MVDLHVHSNRSDGTLSVKELVDYAMTKGLNAFALTDHDTMDGVCEAMEYAQSLRDSGVQGVPEVIPGIELSTDLDGKDVHVVGLYVNQNVPAFSDYLKEFVDERERRNEKMCQKLAEHGVNITYGELKAAFPGAVITRAHYARLMLEKGYIKSKGEAFERYIGDRCPCFVDREKITPEKAVDLILKADGIPILAHPILYRLSDARLESLVKSLKEIGLIGIEAVYSTYSPYEERQIRSLAAKYDLRISGGSDFHGTNKDGIDLAVGMGKLYVDDSILAGLKEARKNLLFTDLDGTLLLNDSTISDAMRDSLRRLTENGHYLVLTSGRPLPSILERIDTLGLAGLHNLYIIANNGGIIYDYADRKILSEKKLSQEAVKEAVSLAVEAGIHVHSYTDSEIVGHSDDEEMKFYRRRIHMPLIETDDIAGKLAGGTYKVQIISLTDHEALEKLRVKINSILNNLADTIFANDYYLEILPKGIDKGTAILWLTDKLAMPHSHTFAAGDAENDLGMIKAAGHGIAIKNGSEMLKKAAEIITEKDNDHDGLIEVIERYFG